MRKIKANSKMVIALILALITGLLSYFAAFRPVDSIDSQNDYPFVLTDEAVTYSFRETLNCQFLIAGDIEFLDDNSNPEEIVIMLQALATYDDRPAVWRGLGWDTEFGENGWSLLVVGNYWYYVWVHDLSSDTPLSVKILVDNLDCADERTLALVNFQQILALQ